MSDSLKNIPLSPVVNQELSKMATPVQQTQKNISKEILNTGLQLDPETEKAFTEDQEQEEWNKKKCRGMLSDPYITSADCPNCGRTMRLVRQHAHTGYLDAKDDKVAIGYECKFCPMAIITIQPARWV